MCQLLIDVRESQDVLGQSVHMFLRRESVRQRHQQIQIPNGFFAATQRTGRGDRVHAFSCLLNVFGDCQRRIFRGANQKPPRGFLEYFHGF